MYKLCVFDIDIGVLNDLEMLSCVGYPVANTPNSKRKPNSKLQMGV